MRSLVRVVVLLAASSASVETLMLRSAGGYKTGPIIEFIRCVAPLDGLTHSGSLMNDEQCGSDFVCLHPPRLQWVG
jgi:hypothetical protein